ncbi:hypothetical protein P9112_014170 [Eukaryota sp. TZLM1-RC]
MVQFQHLGPRENHHGLPLDLQECRSIIGISKGSDDAPFEPLLLASGNLLTFFLVQNKITVTHLLSFISMKVLPFAFLLVLAYAGTRDCDLCLRTVNTLVPFHVKNEHFAKFFLDMACTRIPDLSESSKASCKKFVDDNQSKLMGWIENKQHGDKVCGYLGKCGDQKDNECALCRETSDKLREVLPNYIGEKTFNELANTFCSTYYSALGITKQDCLDYIAKVREQVMVLLNEDSFPDLFCSTLNYC